MRILLITQYFWPETFQINSLAVDLKQNGHDITVLTGIPNYPDGSFFAGYGLINKDEGYHGIKIKRVPLIPRGNGSGLRLALNYLSFTFFALFYGPFKCRENYDVIFVFMPSPITVGIPALMFKKIKKAPILFWVQDLWPETLSATGAIRSPRILNGIEKLARFIYKGCDRILVQSKAFISAIERLGAPKNKLIYFPNPAAEHYKSVSADEQAFDTNELPVGFRIMYGGNIGVAQSFETVIEAAVLLKEYQDIHWVIIGDGRQRAWLTEQIAIRGVEKQFHILGQKAPEIMPYYFSHADALLVNLKKEPVFALTIPSKLQSYLACGKPIVAALDGEAARIIEEAGAGLTGSAEDAQALANNVLALYNMDGQQRIKLGEKGRAYFDKNFDRKQLLNQFENLMQEVTGKIECAF